MTSYVNSPVTSENKINCYLNISRWLIERKKEKRSNPNGSHDVKLHVLDEENMKDLLEKVFNAVAVDSERKCIFFNHFKPLITPFPLPPFKIKSWPFFFKKLEVWLFLSWGCNIIIQKPWFSSDVTSK